MATRSPAPFGRRPVGDYRRKTDFSANANDHGYTMESKTIQVPQDEYDNLRLVAKQYVILCQNLVRGGIDETTLKVLSEVGEGPDSSPLDPLAGETLQPDHPRSETASWRTSNSEQGNNSFQARNDYTHARNISSSTSSFSRGHGSSHSSVYGFGPDGIAGKGRFQDLPDWQGGDEVEGNDRGFYKDGLQGTVGGGHGSGYKKPGPEALDDQPLNQQYRPGDASDVRSVIPRKCLRTLHLVNLRDSATLADVAAVVRGGPVLEFYIRPHDRVAVVSFVHEPQARAFFDHVRRHDLYIKGRRVEIRWSERQFALMGYVGSQINTGATRNLLIRPCDARITEEMIRDDLSHIHNIVVVSVKFADGNCLIETNSVHNALFARNCMMSRLMYKGSRIEWAADECAGVLEKPASSFRPRTPAPVIQKLPVFAAQNRFHLLKLNGGDDNENSLDEDGDEGDDSNDELYGGGGVPAGAS